MLDPATGGGSGRWPAHHMSREADRWVMRCYECDPAEEIPAVMLFAHWKEVHGLQFDLWNPETGSEIDVFPSEPPLATLALEMEQERLVGMIPSLPFWYRPYARWRLKKLAKETADLRDFQIKTLLEEAER